MFKLEPHPALHDVFALLQARHLPTNDLTADHMPHFIGAYSAIQLQGVVGVELLGDDALLRSLAVTVDSAGQGLGVALVQGIEAYAAQQGVVRMTLLTTTAQSFFATHGYKPINRDAAPNRIQDTAEFSSLCPSSAVLMQKLIKSL